MGLFDFAKDIGSKLFKKDVDAAAKITEYISANNPGIDDLSVIFKDGIATIIGATDSAEAAQKVVLMAGNTQGVTEVVPKIQINDVETDVVAALEPGNVEYYVIQSGDSLSKIAKKYYQNAMEYPRIFEANKEVIKDPDLIYPGQKIRIPLD
ncbi:peptidoglycan-binding protein LysM [Methyloprofundus sedimenti]|uniref:Peptidoglycan-binding protein LysM n=1 Tax=Methyloprofundus sedimenti TaxID=1420851 RepID=A0A1V8M0P0_9GAMM|nr:peptidoglycan-binding protein LysM [Methyloprofundus sedimenti]OQK15134.1 peptidoglycan-binding protein LysM [Methyloprofundus sedimenti]